MAQKELLAEDINNILLQINDLCGRIKLSLFAKLDDFFTIYKDSFNNYREILEENFSLTKHF